MEQKIWLKPCNGGDKQKASKNEAFKALAKDQAISSVLDCVYLDTEEMQLLKNDIVLFIQPGVDGLYQTFIRENKDMGYESYESVLIQGDTLETVLFSEDTDIKIKNILAQTPLLIQGVITFELLAQPVGYGQAKSADTKKIVTRFEDEEMQGELYTLEISNMEAEDTDFSVFLKRFMLDAKMLRCTSPFIEAMRIKASGFEPVVSDKKYKKYAQGTELGRIFSIRFSEFFNTLAACIKKGFNKELIHRLRVEIRKSLSLLQAFHSSFGEDMRLHTGNMENMLLMTENLRKIDVLLENIFTMMEEYPATDINSLYEKLLQKREKEANTVIDHFKKGTHTHALLGIWSLIGQMKEQWKDKDTHNKHLTDARIYLKSLAAGLCELKKSGFNDPETIHDVRISIKCIRYVLDMMDDIPKAAREGIASLKKLQSAFGMICDNKENLQKLYDTAFEGSDKALAYHCGLTAGILNCRYRDLNKEVYAVWKEYRPSIEKMGDAL